MIFKKEDIREANKEFVKMTDEERNSIPNTLNLSEKEINDAWKKARNIEKNKSYITVEFSVILGIISLGILLLMKFL